MNGNYVLRVCVRVFVSVNSFRLSHKSEHGFKPPSPVAVQPKISDHQCGSKQRFGLFGFVGPAGADTSSSSARHAFG